MRRRSIIPRGFEQSAHRIFYEYSNPLHPPIVIGDVTESSAEYFLDSPVLNTFPFEDNARNHKNLEKEIPNCCPICLQTASDPVTLLACHHFFCIDCIVKWFQTRLACPLCKTVCSHFIQSSRDSRGQFNLWKTAGEVDSGYSHSTPLGLRSAIKSHQSNFIMDTNQVTVIQSAQNAAPTTKKVRTHYYVPNESFLDRKSITHLAAEDAFGTEVSIKSDTTQGVTITTMDNSNNNEFPTRDNDIALSNDLLVICNELQRLEDELKADYGSEV
jgi:hypothetical protein